MRKVKQQHGRAIAVAGFLAAEQEQRRQRYYRAMADDFRIIKEADKWAKDVTGWDSVERRFFGITMRRIDKHGFALTDPMLEVK